MFSPVVNKINLFAVMTLVVIGVSQFFYVKNEESRVASACDDVTGYVVSHDKSGDLVCVKVTRSTTIAKTRADGSVQLALQK